MVQFVNMIQQVKYIQVIFYLESNKDRTRKAVYSRVIDVTTYNSLENRNYNIVNCQFIYSNIGVARS